MDTLVEAAISVITPPGRAKSRGNQVCSRPRVYALCVTPFGVSAGEVPQLREGREYLQVDPQFQHAINLISSGHFGWADYFNPLVESVTGGRDYYLLANDFNSYLQAQERVDSEWKDKKLWIKKSILSSAGSGKFSSDRTIQEYAEDIWNVSPCPPEP